MRQKNAKVSAQKYSIIAKNLKEPKQGRVSRSIGKNAEAKLSFNSSRHIFEPSV